MGIFAKEFNSKNISVVYESLEDNADFLPEYSS